MKEFLEPLALENTDTHFICTEKFCTDVDNILFTEDIILDKDENGNSFIELQN